MQVKPKVKETIEMSRDNDKDGLKRKKTQEFIKYEFDPSWLVMMETRHISLYCKKS